MSLRIRITRQAINNIDSNKVWWEQTQSADQANEWEAMVSEQIETLADQASICPSSRENHRNVIVYPLQDKRLGVGNRYTHRAVFTIQDETVFVLAVRSTRQQDLNANDMPENLTSA